jgi:ribosomal RNA-processing protein 36
MSNYKDLDQDNSDSNENFQPLDSIQSDSSFDNNDDEEVFQNPLNTNSDFSPSENEDEIKAELEEMELGKLIQAKKRLESENKHGLNKNRKIPKKKIEEELIKKNQLKTKHEPREFSALLKPKNKSFINDTNKEKQIKRDPRFDTLSGELNSDSFKKNFSFVKNEAENYIDKINNLKNLKKNRKVKIEDDEYNLIKKQTNFVKGWLKTKEYENVKDNIAKEFKQENKDRKEKGLNPVYVKEKVIKKMTQKSLEEKRNKKESLKYLKRKQHRDIVKAKKKENIL